MTYYNMQIFRIRTKAYCLFSSSPNNINPADNIDARAEEEQELEPLVESIDKTSTRHTSEISVEDTKLMTNNVNGTQRAVKVKGQKHVVVQASSTLEQWPLTEAQTGGSSMDCTSHCSSDEAEASMEK